MSIISAAADPIFALALGTAVTIFFYVRAKKIKRFSYEIQNAEVISGEQLATSGSLEILYNSGSVPRVTRSLVRFWNSGHETIRGEDIAKADPIRWQLPKGTQILTYNVERVSRSPIQVSVSESLHEELPCLFIKFDFLDNEDGAIISLLHTAISSSPQVMGTVQGIPKGLTSWGASDLNSSITTTRPKTIWDITSSWLFSYGLFVLITSFGIFAATAAAFPEFVLSVFPSLGEPDTSGVLIAGSTNWRYVVFATLLLFGSFLATRFWWRRPPKSLK